MKPHAISGYVLACAGFITLDSPALAGLKLLDVTLTQPSLGRLTIPVDGMFDGPQTFTIRADWRNDWPQPIVTTSIKGQLVEQDSDGLDAVDITLPNDTFDAGSAIVFYSIDLSAEQLNSLFVDEELGGQDLLFDVVINTIAQQHIPEPTSLVLCCVVGAAITSRRSRRTAGV